MNLNQEADFHSDKYVNLTDLSLAPVFDGQIIKSYDYDAFGNEKVKILLVITMRI